MFGACVVLRNKHLHIDSIKCDLHTVIVVAILLVVRQRLPNKHLNGDSCLQSYRPVPRLGKLQPKAVHRRVLLLCMTQIQQGP